MLSLERIGQFTYDNIEFLEIYIDLIINAIGFPDAHSVKFSEVEVYTPGIHFLDIRNDHWPIATNMTHSYPARILNRMGIPLHFIFAVCIGFG